MFSPEEKVSFNKATSKAIKFTEQSDCKAKNHFMEETGLQ